MTEDEAREKWCPFVRSEVPYDKENVVNPVVNRGGYNNRCIASECMAWRTTWATKWTDRRNEEEPDLDPKVWALMRDDEGICEWRSHEPIKGYCGLAGKDISKPQVP